MFESRKRNSNAKSSYQAIQPVPLGQSVKNSGDFENWLDRELNILAGRWIEFTSPNSCGNFVSKTCRVTARSNGFLEERVYARISVIARAGSTPVNFMSSP